MELDLPQIAAFVTAADELHFGRAALRLFLTQQALSKRISRLEQTLGEPLFARRHNIVELTAAGHAFLPYSRKLLDTADEAAHAVIVLRARPHRTTCAKTGCGGRSATAHPRWRPGLPVTRPSMPYR
jgi:DNA-binding transcriptional LysR family regulator